jgi:hypothetical protein
MTSLIKTNLRTLNNVKTINFAFNTPTTMVHGDVKIVITNPAVNRYKVTFNKRYKAVIGGRFQANTAGTAPNSIGFDIKLVDYVLNDSGKTSITLLVTNYDATALVFAFATVASKIFGELKVVA